VAIQVTARPFPAGLDPAYVRALAVLDADGRPKRWEGGPFRHCFGPGLDRIVLEGVADQMSRLSGVPRASSGECNVTWRVATGADTVPGGGAYSDLGNDAEIYRATVVFRSAALAGVELATHESGHVLGLMHSPVATDAMHFDYPASAFSRDEIAVLAWIYGR